MGRALRVHRHQTVTVFVSETPLAIELASEFVVRAR